MARKDPLTQLELRQSVAVQQFVDAASELDEIASELHLLADKNDDVANDALHRAAVARSQANDAVRRAGRIRELLG